MVESRWGVWTAFPVGCILNNRGYTGAIPMRKPTKEALVSETLIRADKGESGALDHGQQQRRHGEVQSLVAHHPGSEKEMRKTRNT
jgi:hypothetical protein